MASGDYFRILTNIGAYNALNALKNVNARLESSLLLLATGLRINSVADDPAGYVISRSLEAKNRGIATAIDNVETAKNVLSIAEGGLQNISDILVTIKEKVTQAASDTNGTSERNAIKNEVSELTGEVDDIVKETSFNNKKLLDGTYTGISFQTGDRPGDRLLFSLNQPHSAKGLNIASDAVVNRIQTATGSSIALSKINAAVSTVNDSLQRVGSVITRLNIKSSVLNVTLTNSEATRSRIIDADIAMERLKAVQYSILQQTSLSQLIQANFIPGTVLSLFRRGSGTNLFIDFSQNYHNLF